MLRFLTAGESHGQALSVIVEGLPAGLSITEEDFQRDLGRRRLGYGRGPRMRFEVDQLRILGGVRHGRTLGSPVSVEIANTEWPKWVEEMNPARVVAGVLAKALLKTIDVDVLSHVVGLGDVEAPSGARPLPSDLDAIDASEVRCFHPQDEAAMIAAIKAAAKAGDSLGGVAEVLAYNVPVGLGSHVHWDRKIDGLLAQALMSIQAIKAVELGEGINVATRRGSDAHDAITFDAADAPTAGGYVRETARAGGIEGGMTSGALLVARLYMKPLASLNRPVLATVDVASKESTVSFKERTDVTAVPAMGVVAEAMTALVLAGEAQRKFGGDSVAEFTRNHESYVAHLGETVSGPRA